MGWESEAAAYVGLSTDHGLREAPVFSTLWFKFRTRSSGLSQRREVIGCESNVAG
jgi:hypothetical protein